MIPMVAGSSPLFMQPCLKTNKQRRTVKRRIIIIYCENRLHLQEFLDKLRNGISLSLPKNDESKETTIRHSKRQTFYSATRYVEIILAHHYKRMPNARKLGIENKKHFTIFNKMVTFSKIHTFGKEVTHESLRGVHVLLTHDQC